MVFKATDTERGARGFTLVEMMIAFALCCLLLAGMMSLYSFTTSSFASLTSYTALSQKTRSASDIISRDLRCSTSVDDTTTSNKLVLNTLSGAKVTYLYDSTAQTLVRSNSAEVRQLLADIVSLSFSLYQRPTNRALAYEVLPAGNPGSAKLVGFQWKCARRIVGSHTDSQDLQAGIVELRNQ